MEIVLLGAEGHASDVVDLVQRATTWRIAAAYGVTLPDVDRLAERGVTITTSSEGLRHLPFIAAIGYPAPRAKAVATWDVGAAPSVVDPTAVVSPSSSLGDGTTVFWHAAVSPRCVVGQHVLVSYAATLGHDCHIGDFAAILPGAHVSGDVVVGARALVGSGAVVLQGVRIGEAARVGAGAVVTRDVPPGETVISVPARR